MSYSEKQTFNILWGNVLKNGIADNKSSMRIAVLMTCYNRLESTRRCLKGLAEQDVPPNVLLDVWLVDDNSPDKTGMYIKREWPTVNVIEHRGGLFWCKGMRVAWDAAVAYSCYDYYLWINDDVILNRNALKILLSDYNKVKSVIVGTFASSDNYADVSYGATKFIPSGEPRVADAPMNGNLVIIPKYVYEIVGPIFDGYHHQYGDYDYGMMLNRNRIDFYASSAFVGVCPQQPERYHHLSCKTLIQRFRLLFDPKGYDLHDAFLFKYRNWGVIRAVISVCHVIYIVVVGKEL